MIMKKQYIIIALAITMASLTGSVYAMNENQSEQSSEITIRQQQSTFNINMIEVPLEVLVADSKHAVNGIVESSESKIFTPEGERNDPVVVTDYIIVITDDIYDNYDAGKVLVRTYGGETKSLKMDCHGCASFEIGEEIVVLLADEEDASGYGNNLHVAGLEHGVFKVSDNTARNTVYDSLDKSELIADIQTLKNIN